MDEKRKEKLQALLAGSPFNFKDVDDHSLNQYDIALTQRTYTNEKKQQTGILTGDYERLEFVGGYVLNLVIAETQYRDSPNAEGAMTQKLGNLAENLKLPSILSKYSEILNAINIGGQPIVDNIKADILESLIGATFILYGYPAARDLVVEMFGDELDNFAPVIDWKSGLQIYVQNEYRNFPINEILIYDKPKEIGPDGLWHTTVRVNNHEWGTGKGKRRKDAEMNAAKNAHESHCSNQ